MKPAPKETILEDENHSDKDEGSDGFDDMEDIPLDVKHAVEDPTPAPAATTVKRLLLICGSHKLLIKIPDYFKGNRKTRRTKTIKV